MVKIRLRRTGKTKQPHYRVVIADSRSPRDGRFIEIIGYYSPTQQPKVLHIKADRARYWLGVGAQPSDTVIYLLKKEGIIDEQGNVLPESSTESLTQASEQVSAPVAADVTEVIAVTEVTEVEEVVA